MRRYSRYMLYVQNIHHRSVHTVTLISMYRCVRVHIQYMYSSECALRNNLYLLLIKCGTNVLVNMCICDINTIVNIKDSFTTCTCIAEMSHTYTFAIHLNNRKYNVHVYYYVVLYLSICIHMEQCPANSPL